MVVKLGFYLLVAYGLCALTMATLVGGDTTSPTIDIQSPSSIDMPNVLGVEGGVVHVVRTSVVTTNITPLGSGMLTSGTHFFKFEQG